MQGSRPSGHRSSRSAWLPSALLLAAATLATSTASAVVVNALPYGTSANNPATNSPEWTVIVFSDTQMTVAGGVSTLTTANSRGVWFGNGSAYGDTPPWSIGSNTSGNYLSMTASFSGARDWSAYLYDRTHFAAINFAPTACNGNIGSCYAATPYAGVSVAHAMPGNPSTYAETLVPLNLNTSHTFEWLLKDGVVSYRIDGQVAYSGAAWAVVPGASWIANGGFLLIGDSSGPTLTGTGSMHISALSFDTAPAAMTLVPEPATAWLWAAGLLALVARRRR
ncbi:MAG: PEP-CTERM sorting domain-containing protein [Rubrivivax sp.]|nr:PEP-CTERM sorting domain-containing protein [Rubrivivax sp.]MDP3084103.1 PEP-CTERM sorting domain-containing protein [Rubrivivax sp.]